MDRAFKTIRNKLTTAPVLADYNPNEKLVLSVDSSSTALGAVLLQNGRPLGYASRALSDVQQRYAQIKKKWQLLFLELRNFINIYMVEILLLKLIINH